MDNFKSNIFGTQGKAKVNEKEELRSLQIENVFEKIGVTDEEKRREILKRFETFKISDLPSIALKLHNHIFNNEEDDFEEEKGEDTAWIVFLLYCVELHRYNPDNFNPSDFGEKIDKANMLLETMAHNSAFFPEKIPSDQGHVTYLYMVANDKYFYYSLYNAV